MSDYCDILRTRSATDTYALQILRYASQEVLEGQINGRALEQSFSFADQISDETSTTPVASTEQATGGYITIQDDSGAIQISIPAEWTQVDGQNWVDGDLMLGASITASADAALNAEYYQPGVFFGASDQIAKLGGYVQLLDVYRDIYSKDCTLNGRNDYKDSAFEGKYDIYTECLNEKNTMVVLTARPINAPTSMLITLVVNMMSDSDFEALDQMLASFDVVSTLFISVKELLKTGRSLICLFLLMSVFYEFL